MEYKLFDEFITLQSLLKTNGIFPSGGAIKVFLTDNLVLFNGEPENRRGKKIRIGDTIQLPDQDIIITIVAPSEEEKAQHLQDFAEKERVAKIVKKMNKKFKKENKQKPSSKKIKTANKAPVRFPGT